ncbi:MAG: hypothetical protein K9I59_09055 [Chlorobium sp.]|uniref:hypothetical protein n=1 Tax=Chlorobium sp. TaxID=1095 RepID=UPI001D64D5CB|nr:hypothetical protein [Chlorobium sp.]MBN1279157.1 hypothetical protein [Chlorobiaceae bacterium]MCF8216968.1 hypothetical protein [Chlorobium sp.]MCF8271797.1 hypothetical protein [Chlorobium sp.]MCF8288185.1 hypothetical protein [Chlorobium sp.]MCF8291767.1 hypothetical protein [Chlorobium sp.]
MLRLDELRADINAEFYVHEELKVHDVRKVNAIADLIIKPSGRKDLRKLLALLAENGFPHIVINSKGRVVFPDGRFQGAVIITDISL